MNPATGWRHYTAPRLQHLHSAGNVGLVKKSAQIHLGGVSLSRAQWNFETILLEADTLLGEYSCVLVVSSSV